MTVPPSPLDDPANAAHAWARYKRIMGYMAWLTLVVVAAVLVLLFEENGFVSINLFIAAALGIGGMMLLTAALMGLVFLSSGTGHDAAVVNPLEDED
jgi:pheromone shutdown protein TraB